MSQQQYDISLGANYDLFNDAMNSTLGTGSSIWGAGDGSGYTISTGTDTLTWNDMNSVWATTPTSPLKVNGDAEIDGDLKVKGKSLSEAIENIEKRLAILHPNKKLEEKWEELKALGERYRELEKDILEKEQIWDIIKK